jgi:hypothetical protein
LLLSVLVLATAWMGGCSVYLSEHCPGTDGPYAPYVYGLRDEFESARGGWGKPVAQASVDGHAYLEYATTVHGRQERGDASRYAYADLLTLGLAELVTVPREIVRLSGACDYTAHLRVEWTAEGEPAAWMWGKLIEEGVRWGKRETEIPSYFATRARRAVPEGGGPRDLGEGR